MLLRHFSPVVVRTLLVAALLASAFAGETSPDRGDVRAPNPARAPEPTYKIQAGIDGEIYPVFANYASLQNQSERAFGTLALTITNPGQNLIREHVTVSIQGWSDQEIQIAEVPPGAVRTLIFAPSFLPRFYRNREIIAASAKVSIGELGGRTVYETTVPVRLRSSEDMYWGNGFKYASFIASWVTPHDALVEDLLSRAKQYTPDHRLPGYENWKNAAQQEQETFIEAKAIFHAVKRLGLSYVKSSLTLGDHKNVSERVRMPHSSLGRSSANCIDAAVLYASLFENLGMEPSVIIVPGHAYAGVKVAEGSQNFLYIDVALTGRTTFEAAVASAQAGMARRSTASVTRVDIEDARSAGIYPMP